MRTFFVFGVAAKAKSVSGHSLYLARDNPMPR
jgi:hypothetical protein